MAVRFYVDADLLGLAKLLWQVRDDVTYPGDPGDQRRAACPVVAPRTPDRVWIPEVAALGWVAITHDRHIMSRPDERAAVLGSHARHIILVGKDALAKWGQLEIVVSQWREIERLALDLPGPWVYGIGRSSKRKVL